MGCALADWPPVGKPMRDRKPKTPPIAKVSPQSPGRTVPWGVGRLPRSSPAPQLWRGGWWLTTEARVGTWSPVTPHQLTKLKGAVQWGPCRMPPEGTCRDTFPGFTQPQAHVYTRLPRACGLFVGVAELGPQPSTKPSLDWGWQQNPWVVTLQAWFLPEEMLLALWGLTRSNKPLHEPLCIWKPASLVLRAL